MDKNLNNDEFYDSASNYYDLMISSEKAILRKKEIFKKLFKSKGIYAADLGCGSGVDSIALGLNKIKVDAFDPSRGMIEIASKNFKKNYINVKCYNYSIDKIPTEFNSKYDLVLSLGNTFANIHINKLDESFRKINLILKPEGECYIQILNYHLIKQSEERIININDAEENFVIRFYDFLSESMKFNILQFSKNDPTKKKLISIDIFPHTNVILRKSAERAGFCIIEFFADLELNEFDINNSKNLVMRVTKSSVEE